MPIKRIKFDDGSIAQIEVPEGATNEQINAFVSQNMEQIKAKARPQLQQREVYDSSNRPDRGSFLNPLLAGATFEFADEAMGAIAATYAKMHDLVTGKDSGVTYADAVESLRKDKEAFAERNPITSTALEITGGLTTGGLGAYKTLGSQALKRTPEFIQKAAPLMVAGAEGALYGTGRGETMEERAKFAGTDALTSVFGGYILNRLGQKLGQVVTAPQAKALIEKLTPTKDLPKIKAEAKKFYKDAEDAGVVIKPDVWDNFKTAFMNDLRSQGIDQAGYSRVAGALNLLEKTGTPTYKDIEKIKRKLKTVRQAVDQDNRRVANTIAYGIDDFVENLQPSDVLAGRVQDLGSNLKQAKNLWSRKATTEMLDDIEYEAEISPSMRDFDDFDKAVSTATRPILRKIRKGTMSVDEDVKTSLETILKGTPGKKLVRDIAQVEPGAQTRRGLLAATGAGTTAFLLTGNPALSVIAAALPGITGNVARRLANSMTRKEIKKLRNAVLNRGQLDKGETIEAILEPYKDIITAGTTSAAATTSDDTRTTLQDMMQ